MTAAKLGNTRRWRWMSIVAAANLAAVGLVAAPSQAHHRPSLCSGVAENLTISGDLAVPAGESCSLIGTTVRGDVEVRAEASLSLDGSTIRDDLVVRDNGFVSALDSSVDGSTTLRRAFGASVEGSELDGRVSARDSGFFFSDGTQHDRVYSRGGQTIIFAGWVDGDLRTSQDLLTDVRDTVVTGRVVVDEAELGSVICRSEVDDDVVLRGSGDVIQLGGGAEVADCEFNVFGDDVKLLDNTAAIEINDNVIRGDLACEGNQPAPTGANNRVRGALTGQCADLAPAAAALRAPSAGTAEDRVAAVRAQIETRSADAAEAVAQAGPADL